MKNKQQATHNHKRVGPVVLLESTTELAKVFVLASEDEFWVKLTDLTLFGDNLVENSRDMEHLIPLENFRLIVGQKRIGAITTKPRVAR